MDTSKQKKLLDLIASDARFREEELAVMLGESVDEIKKTIADNEAMEREMSEICDDSAVEN